MDINGHTGGRTARPQIFRSPDQERRPYGLRSQAFQADFMPTRDTSVVLFHPWRPCLLGG